MINAILTDQSGKPMMLLIGLSHRNLDLLREQGLSGYIKISGKDIDLPIDVMITAAAISF
jgi:hypothetical protein